MWTDHIFGSVKVNIEGKMEEKERMRVNGCSKRKYESCMKRRGRGGEIILTSESMDGCVERG